MAIVQGESAEAPNLDAAPSGEGVRHGFENCLGGAFYLVGHQGREAGAEGGDEFGAFHGRGFSPIAPEDATGSHPGAACPPKITPRSRFDEEAPSEKGADMLHADAKRHKATQHVVLPQQKAISPTG